MKKILFFCFTLLISVSTFAQSSKNSIQLELGGHGSFYTINYERLFLDLDWTKTSAQIGVAYYPLRSGMIPLWIPVTINQMFRVEDKHFVEIGGGMMLMNEGLYRSDNTFEDNYQMKNMVFRLGYRFHSKNGNWVYRGGYMPILLRSQSRNFDPVIFDTELIHWAGVSIGYRF